MPPKMDKILRLIDQIISLDAIRLRSNLVQKHIAVIMKGGKILEFATNFVGSRSQGCGYDQRSIHAERAVLKKFGNERGLSGTIMVVIRIKNDNRIMNSEPCHTCKCHLAKCMNLYGMKRVYYSS